MGHLLSEGVVQYGSREECLVAAEQSPMYFHGIYLENGVEVRYEKTPLFVTESSADGKIGKFEWRLPKIPRHILNDVRDFFALVSENYGTEALVQIGFVKERGKYVLIVPEQNVDKTSVTTSEVISASWMYHVLDIYSHNTREAFFSKDDGTDGRANRIYGVIGCLDKDEPEMLFRATAGGKFVSVSSSDIFSDDEGGVPMAEPLYRQWCDVVTFK